MSYKLMDAEDQLEWLWANCKIIYWDEKDALAYPLEHTMVAGKDMRQAIENKMKPEPMEVDVEMECRGCSEIEVLNEQDLCAACANRVYIGNDELRY